MRSSYIPPSLEEFASILESTSSIRTIRGGSLSDIEIFRVPARSVRGGGLFSLLSGIARKVVPFIARAVKPSAIEFGQNVISDLQQGNGNFKQVLRRRGFEALGSAGRRVLRGEGVGRRRLKRNMKKKMIKKKKKKGCAIKRRAYKDVFSLV